jgi:hypothetical protein
MFQVKATARAALPGPDGAPPKVGNIKRFFSAKKN